MLVFPEYFTFVWHSLQTARLLSKLLLSYFLNPKYSHTSDLGMKVLNLYPPPFFWISTLWPRKQEEEDVSVCVKRVSRRVDMLYSDSSGWLT